MRASWPDLSQMLWKMDYGEGGACARLTTMGHMNSIHTDIPPPPNFEQCCGSKSSMLTLLRAAVMCLTCGPPAGGLKAV